eukprot:gene15116-biopygen5168
MAGPLKRCWTMAGPPKRCWTMAGPPKRCWTMAGPPWPATVQPGEAALPVQQGVPKKLRCGAIKKNPRRAAPQAPQQQNCKREIEGMVYIKKKDAAPQAPPERKDEGNEENTAATESVTQEPRSKTVPRSQNSPASFRRPLNVTVLTCPSQSWLQWGPDFTREG